MSDALPPLTALRAFEAAARHMSFARAADELHVTPAALSFQIKSLEAHLGTPVFKRLNRAVELTEAGAALAPSLTDGFSHLNHAWRTARRQADHSVLIITAGPAFTTKWLAPRLYGFVQAEPDIELRFSATLRMMDLARDDVDAAIRFGPGGDKGVYSRTLINEWVTPMMTPALAEQYRTPRDLLGATLLHQDIYPFRKDGLAWSSWFAAQGLPDPPENGPRFADADHAHSAALAGSGVVFGRYSLAEQAIRDGHLVAPFRLAIRTKHRYRYICPLGAETRPHLARFETWLFNEVKEMQPFSDKHDFIDEEDLAT
ncbi:MULTISPECIES: transcriptional regulator GcvA [Halocynthiibacter]|uniref:Transcriptional regulator GcvA n=1 Tax=Halocynthiibacter halioticoli TaxID=2986804 RepID=A0AAE3IYK2_9RHOB|nr:MULTISPECIES: transcriptional regulator GcvA [Halocynthiibacter]MCV6823283.1 transcriptional regulator GcvA [Halocynthiibacter halioticoli]MCW4056284.1 transcriptional regulator GcvA [Halocynthiibacter sp. SDUM655004]